MDKVQNTQKARPGLIRLLSGVGLLVVMLLGGSAPVEGVVLESDLAFDLLVLHGPPQGKRSIWAEDMLWSELDHEQLALTLFDTYTGERSLVETPDMPLGQEALSPDGHYLAVYRDQQVCIVDRHWQTGLCLAPDRVALAHARQTLGPRIFWEPDSASFWILRDRPEPSIAQISVPDGDVLRSLKVENPSGQANEVYLFNLYPIGRRFLLGFRGDCCYLFDLDTGDLLHRQGMDFDLSPDAHYAASFGEDGLGAISTFEFSPDLDAVIPVPTAQIGPPSAWSAAPELAWAESEHTGGTDLVVRFWSHDSRKIAFHRLIFQGGEDVGFVGVYFLDTQEVRILGQDQWEFAYVYWSPDDSAIAVLPTDTGYPAQSGTELTIFTLDGSTFSVLDQEELVRVYSANWVPHGWLQNSVR